MIDGRSLIRLDYQIFDWWTRIARKYVILPLPYYYWMRMSQTPSIGKQEGIVQTVAVL
jgi:hypothetical protein